MTIELNVVMAIHNEERYLPYSLNRLKDAPLDLIVFVLDRCNDKSEAIVRAFKPKFRKIVVIKQWNEWKNPASETFAFGTEFCDGDVVFHVGGDFLVDFKMFNKDLWKDEDVGIVSFRYDHYQLFEGSRLHCFYENAVMRIFEKLGFGKLRGCYPSGAYGFRREIWQRIKLKDVPSDYDRFIRDVEELMIKGSEKTALQYDDFLDRVKHRYQHLYVKTKSLHLRAGLTKSRQYLQGVSRVYMKYPLWKVIGHCIIHLKFHVFKSFILARNKHIGKKWLQGA